MGPVFPPTKFEIIRIDFRLDGAGGLGRSLCLITQPLGLGIGNRLIAVIKMQHYLLCRIG